MKCLSVTAVLCFVICLLSFSVSADTGLEFLPFDKELYYGRKELSRLEGGKDLVKVYDMLVEAVENGQQSFMVNSYVSVHDIEITCDQMQLIAAAYRFDNPQQFWWGRVSYNYYVDNDEIDGNELVRDVMLEYLEFDIPTAREEFHNACVQFIEAAGITEGMSEYEISKILYEAVIEHIQYDLNAPNAHNAYGALIGGRAVCEGYAELYQYLLYLNGIQSHIVTGYADGDHAWNLVRLAGKYYQTDPTWGDQTTYVSYRYLNTTTALLLRERSIDDHGYQIPDCTSDDASYYVAEFGRESCFDTEPFLDNVAEQLRKRGYAKLCYNGEGSFDYIAWFGKCEASIREALEYYGQFGGQGNGIEFTLIAKDYVFPDEPVIPDAPLKGDTDGDGVLNQKDAVYLLYSIMFEDDEEYKPNQACDFNGDGNVTSKDAVYLLYHIFFGESEYPLHTAA